MFYVYVDWTLEEEPRPFYVGKGNEYRILFFKRNGLHAHNSKVFGCERRIFASFEDEKLAFEEEINLIRELHTYKKNVLYNGIGANFTPGGEGPSFKGRKLSEEHKRKISMSLRAKSHPCSAETRLKMSISAKKRGILSETLAKAIAINVGHPKSLEHKKKISLALKGRKGKKHSLETKLKISEIVKARRSREREAKLQYQNFWSADLKSNLNS